MSHRGKKVDLRLNLAPPPSVDAAGRTAGEDFPRESSSTASPAISCVSSEEESPAASMVLAACPRCIMYVMLSEDDDAKCPKCKSAVLLDFLCGGGGGAGASSARKKTRNNI